MNRQDEENLIDDLGIAIISMSGRFPQAEDTNQFWQNLKDGVESISFFSEQELLESGVKAELLNDPNYVKASAVMSDIDMFDANFFAYSRKEAEDMDPQQRLFLECAWETIERGGYNPDTYEGLIGVYAGIGMNQYLFRNLYPNHDPDNPVNSYQLMISSDKDFLATRVAYKLNLRGPAVNVQTACSTSLVAVHMACQSLLNGECDLALAGGVSIHIPQKVGHLYREGMIFSPDGHCRTFDAKAKGTIPGDGVGIVLLKRLNNAIADGDSIHAIIKGSSINNDGSLKVGYTAPSIEGQAAVISEAHAVAGVDPETISYIEAHGTGTELGDPVEIAALTQAFNYSTEKKGFCAIGSLKSNMGHLDAAAGVAGLIKTVLALKHKLLPPTLHFEEPNPKIDFANSPLYVNTTLSEWKTNGTPRRAGVSSFGIGGTNAHVILEEAPELIKKENSPERPLHLLTLAAKTPEALEQLVARYQNYIETHQELEIADICYTANTGRKHFNHRLAVIASNQQELLEKLKAHQSTEAVTEMLSGEISGTRIAFLFTGQGSQYVDMGRQLYETQPTFQKILDQCNEILKEYLEVPILEVIYPKDAQKSSSDLLNQTAYTQPAIFALEYALFKLWESWGVKPDVVMGHSVGEYVAACITGVFSLEDGLKLIAMRGKLMQKLPSGGKMVSVMASESQVTEAIKEYSSQVTIAAVNGPESIVISGESAAITNICSLFESVGVKTKQLQVSHGFHSTLMEPMLTEFAAVAKEIAYNQAKIPLISNVTGTEVGAEITTAEYWVAHVRQPVKFAQSMKTLEEEGYETFLEIGPKPILLSMGRQCVTEDVGEWLPSLRPGVDEWQQMLYSLGQLYVKGVKIDWSGFDSDYSRQKVLLPTYPFQRERYWVETPEDQHQKLIPESSLSPIVNLLNQGNSEGLIQELNLATQLTKDEQKILPKLLDTLVSRHQSYIQFKGNIVYDFYNSVTDISAEAFEKVYGEEQVGFLQFLSFGILPETVPGFSWIKIFSNPNQPNQKEFSKLVSDAQKELRELCFAQVNFLSCQNVLDFGCGYSSDLIDLAQKHPHLQLTGYTISSEQAKFGTKQVSAYQFQDRIQVLNRDSSQDEFPDNYNLVFGFEVAHHIKNKNNLFSNISRHLEQEGLLVLADFIANSDVDIDHEETSSYFITKQHWVEKLSENHLQLISAIDVSQEIANFLYDPDFEESQDALYKKNNDDRVKYAFESYNQLGKLLQKGLASYVLLTAKKQEHQTKQNISQLNQEILDQLLSYSEVATKQWVYELEWKATEAIKKESSTYTNQEKPRTWVLFVSHDLNGQELAKMLEKDNKNCVLVSPGDNYKQLDQQHYQINPTNPQDFKELLQTLLTTQEKLEGVVHLWSLDSSTEDLESAQELGCGSVLHLVQGLVSNPESQVVLWLVTQGTQSVGQNSQVSQVQQAPLWGLGRVIAAEHPELQCRRVDLDQTSNSSEALQALAKELLDPDIEDQIAIRQGVRYAPRLARPSHNYLEQQQQVKLEQEGCYLITGGLGALGLEVAQWMVQQGAKHLVLTGRSNPSEKAVEIIKQLEQTGTQVSVLLGDISHKQDVAKIIDSIQNSLPPLKGVIHAAGVLDDGVLQQMSWDRFTKVMAPKVQGTWYLHELTQNLDLDFFVCFSSITSFLGSPGQGNYAAANAFMDGIAHYRQAMGLPGLTINWGAWSQGGMAVSLTSQHQNRLQNTGISSIAPEKGLEILGKLLSQSVSQVGVFPVNWSQFFAQLSEGVQTPLFLEDFASSRLAKKSKSEEFLGELAVLPEKKRHQRMVDYLQIKVGKLLGSSQSQLPNTQLGFFDMGMDSLMAVELRNILSHSLGSSISAATLFEASNIQKLAKYLINDLFPEEQSGEIESGDRKNIQSPNIVESEETQSETEIEDRIAQELEEIFTTLDEGN
ncbi:type I polyketide synthase [Dapis sp. BLCC M229]|uniref:type I polyketide synthase n=1 Tax=Dapis sp. BLCC M229 TaxID=3400188 RepID=UPI003CECB0C4